MKNISKIISIVFLSFSILLLCYVFYRSQIFHNGTRFDYYFKYYVIAFLLIILSLISFFIPKKLKIKITIVFVSILIALYLVDGYLIIKNKDNRFVIYKNNTGKDFDKRNTLEIYNDLKKEDPNIIITTSRDHLVNSNNINYLPLSDAPNRRTIYCNENGYYSIYQTDRYGFNNPDMEWDKDEIDYLLIGDSFTHGACVNEPDTISGNLRKLNNSRNGVLNLGQHSSGSLIEHATLREYFPVKKVKRVLWLYYGNDLGDLQYELNNKILISYLNNKNYTQNLILKKQEVEKIILKELERQLLLAEKLSRVKMSVKLNKFTTLIKFLRLDSIRGISFFSQTIYSTKKFKNILKLSYEFAEQNNSKLYFIYLPGYYHDTYKNYKEVMQVVESLNIPLIDLYRELFEKHKDPLSLFPFRKNGHYNELGYQLVAKTIFNKINELEK